MTQKRERREGRERCFTSPAFLSLATLISDERHHRDWRLSWTTIGNKTKNWCLNVHAQNTAFRQRFASSCTYGYSSATWYSFRILIHARRRDARHTGDRHASPLPTSSKKAPSGKARTPGCSHSDLLLPGKKKQRKGAKGRRGEETGREVNHRTVGCREGCLGTNSELHTVKQ